VTVREIEAADGGAFGAIVAAGFELPDWTAAMFGAIPGRPGWRCYLAEVDGEPAGTGAMYVEDGKAELNLGATLAAARGRGCQTALLQRRIEDAEGAGCRAIFVETGERAAGRPSASYRNILRAGFEEVYVRPNWQRPG
jgi:GNAT superfamily N-acetyltransferase